MSLAQLGLCASAIYSCFLLWGLLQERLSSHVYHASRLGRPFLTGSVGKEGSLLSSDGVGDRFSSPLFLNTVQCLFCTVIAAFYLLFVKGSQASGKTKQTPLRTLGLHAVISHKGEQEARKPAPPIKANGSAATASAGSLTKKFLPPLLGRYLSISFSQSLASQLGFLALAQGLSYPTLTLAKSCKLVPVLIMNVVLYRRKFAPYKYAVVTLVTVGISIFMLYGKQKKKTALKKPPPGNSLLGVFFLVANLVLDGATNSTQDEVFTRYTLSGPQMMLVMNGLSFLLMLSALLFPVHRVLVLLPEAVLAPLAKVGLVASGRGSSGEPNELLSAIHFIATHDQILRDVVAYAAAGAFGQVAIFETLERFGSLTLVSITVTRKLFTMLLSVFMYNHKLTPAQWLGASIVFLGIGLEAREKRREGLAKKVHKEDKKALAKDA